MIRSLSDAFHFSADLCEYFDEFGGIALQLPRLSAVLYFSIGDGVGIALAYRRLLSNRLQERDRRRPEERADFTEMLRVGGVPRPKKDKKQIASAVDKEKKDVLATTEAKKTTSPPKTQNPHRNNAQNENPPRNANRNRSRARPRSARRSRPRCRRQNVRNNTRQNAPRYGARGNNPRTPMLREEIGIFETSCFPKARMCNFSRSFPSYYFLTHLYSFFFE